MGKVTDLVKKGGNMVKAPVQVKEVFEALQQFRLEADKPVKILVAHEADVNAEGFIDELARAGERSIFHPLELVDSDSTDYLNGLLALVSQADLSVLFLDADKEFGAAAISFNVVAREARQPYLVVMIGAKASAGMASRKQKVERFLEMPHANVVDFVPGDENSLLKLTERMLRESDKDIAVASRLPVFRKAASEKAITRTAWQNAFLSAATILPGADMPVLTFNQIKMVLLIAAIYGEEMTTERAKELLAVVGGGFTFRAVARQLLDFVPGAGWVIKGGVAYSGTIAMGKAAQAYFESGRYLTTEDVKNIINKAVRSRKKSK